MPQVPSDHEKLKSVFKAALVEVLKERKDSLRDLIEETDIARARAIEQGRLTGDAGRGEILSILEGSH